MPETTTARKTRHKKFLAALKLAELRMEDWAKQQGVSQGYVSNVLIGERENEELEAAIDAFIAAEFRKMPVP